MKALKKDTFSKIKGRIGKPIHKIKDRFSPCVEFLSAGRTGGIIAMLLLASQFDITKTLIGLDFPKPVTMLLSAVFSIIMVEVLLFVIKLLFGGGRQSKMFFFFAWFIVCTANFIGVEMLIIVPPIIMSFLLTLAVDVLGRCIFAFIKQGKFKQKFGYILGSFSIIVMILYGIFFHTDNFGKSRIEPYLKAAMDGSVQTDGSVQADDAVQADGSVQSDNSVLADADFESYIKDGTNEVEEYSYGPGEDFDIHTETIDVTGYATVEDRSFFDKLAEIGSDYDFKETPIAGEIYCPKAQTDCPTLIIVHGAHTSADPSYLGYEYLGRYLASNGYVVISVDENIINDLNTTNDIRAIVMLENIKAILKENEDLQSPIYGKIDASKLAIAGHSRGGESVATVYLFNGLDTYPEDGNRKFDYHFDISAIIAIAPTVDQYMPVNHAVKISDVDYLIIHGSNDQDVTSVMGEKQYNNVTFSKSGDRTFRKASVYIMGANHGQFNSEWGRYDIPEPCDGYLNTANFLTEEDQQLIAKAYIRTFLDTSFGIDDTFSGLLSDNVPYLSVLPRTVYITNYMDSDFERIFSFDDSVNAASGLMEEAKIDCTGMKRWTLKQDVYGGGGEGENYVLDCKWEKDGSPVAVFTFPADLSSGCIVFRIADMREDIDGDPSGLSYSVELTDEKGKTMKKESPVYIYPSIGVQLYKQDVLFGNYEYKHQMQTIRIDREMFDAGSDFDFGHVKSMSISFNGSSEGEVIIDDIGVYK